MSARNLYDSGLRAAIIGNAAAFLSNLVLLRHSPGEAIRPMDLPFYCIAIGIATFFCAFPSGFTAFRSAQEPIWLYGFFAMILSVTPFISGSIGLVIITEIMGFHLKP